MEPDAEGRGGVVRILGWVSEVEVRECLAKRPVALID